MSKKVIAIAIAILVCGALVPNLNAQVQVEAYEEQFESAWIPSGWTTTVDYGCDEWRRNDHHTGMFWNSHINMTGGSGYCAVADDDYWWCYPQNNRLISPTVTAAAHGIDTLSNIHLDYKMYAEYFYYTYEYMDVEIDTGTGWVTLVEYRDMYGESRLESFPLGDSMQSIRVRFSYTSNWWGYGTQVDDVVIWGEVPSGPGGDSLDLEMVQIIRPHSLEEGGVPFTPECKIYNNLDTTAHAMVRCRIKDIETQETVYEDVLSVVPCEPDYTTCDGFKDFTPEGNKRYNALFVVEHPDDVDDSNDSKDKKFATEVGMQVDATEIIEPADDQIGTFGPQADFKEMQGAEARRIWLWVKIEDGTYHNVVHLDSIGPEDFDPDEEKSPPFSEVGNEILTTGSYTITFWATDAEKKSIGEEIFKEFNYTEAIAEAPIIEDFSLNVVGTKVNYTLGKATEVSLRIYDVTGNLVTTLASGTHNAGSYSVDWNTTGVTSGVYFVKMRTPEFTASGKMVVLY